MLHCKDGDTLIDQHMPIGKQLKDRDTLIEQSPCMNKLIVTRIIARF